MNTYLPVEPLASRNNYSLLIMGINNGDGYGGGDRWRWLRGHFPVMAGCRNRDFISLESPFRWRRHYGGFSGSMIDPLGFLGRSLLIGEEGEVGGGPGVPHPLWARPRVGPCPPRVWPSWFPPPSHFRFSVSLREKYELWLLSRPIPRIFIF